MKEIKEERFKKKEEIGFNPAPIAPNPPPIVKMPAKKEGSDKTNERSNERTFERKSPSGSGYVIIVPEERRKTRQSFDIFEDQYDALKKLQVAEADKKGGRSGQKLGEMVQEALDSFIREKSKKLGNINVIRD